MRSSSLQSSLRQYSLKKCEARLGYHSGKSYRAMKNQQLTRNHHNLVDHNHVIIVRNNTEPGRASTHSDKKIAANEEARLLPTDFNK